MKHWRKYIIYSFSVSYVAARQQLYGNCSASNNHLDPNTKAFVSDCDSFGYCSSNGTCQPKLCRRDPFVLDSIADGPVPVPPLCDVNEYCPDDASGCAPRIGLGGTCELNRDDQCEGYSAQQAYRMSTDDSQVTICLLGACTLSNVTLGGNCSVEITVRPSKLLPRPSLTLNITRDDCLPNVGYCDTTTRTCLQLKILSAFCDSDRECESDTCLGGVCMIAPDFIMPVASWLYLIIAFCLAASMAAVLYVLVSMHRKAEEKRREILHEYYREQSGYRNSILSFESAWHEKAYLNNSRQSSVRLVTQSE